MKKKIMTLILFILITLMTTTIFAAVTANVSLILSKSAVKPGEEFTVKLRMKDIDAGNDGLMGAQCKINYDKNVFETLTDDRIKGLSGLTDNYNESNKGNILIVSAMSGIKTESDFVEVTFKVKEGVATGKTDITFQDIEVFNLEKSNIGSKSVTVDVTNGNAGNEGDGGNTDNEATPTPTPPTTKPTETPDGGSESTPTPSTKPNNTAAPTATAKPNSGENKNDVPVTNIDTNISNGSTSSGTDSSNKGTTSGSSSAVIKGSTTSSSSLPKAGIGSAITILTVIVAAIGTVAYIKLRKYREI